MDNENRYAFVVGADRAFFPAANALLNSLDYIGFDGEVHFILFDDFSLEYIEEARKRFRFSIIPQLFMEELFKRNFSSRKADYMKRLRYQVAAHIVDSYDAVCFLDVDMFFVRPIDLFFEIASHGIMLGAAKTGKVRYGGNSSYYVDGRDIVENPIWNEKDICCCPIFFNKDFKKVFENVYYAYTTDIGRMKASDLFAINGMILRNGADKRLVTMPCHSWVGTNEVMLKPFTRVIEKEGQLISENGDLVYSVHGKWFSEGWHNGQILHMDRIIDSYLGNKKHWEVSYKRAMSDIMRWFMKMQTWKIDLRDWSQYVKPEHLEFMFGGGT